jgi:hypothetical protein
MRFFTKTLDPEIIFNRTENDSNSEEKRNSNPSNVLEKTWTGEVAVASESQHAVIDSEAISPEAQRGVQKIEATTSAWTKRDLIIAYVL